MSHHPSSRLFLTACLAAADWAATASAHRQDRDALYSSSAPLPAIHADRSGGSNPPVDMLAQPAYALIMRAYKRLADGVHRSAALVSIPGITRAAILESFGLVVC